MIYVHNVLVMNSNYMHDLYIIGDYESALDILKMAIALIKQSITAGTDSNQVTKLSIVLYITELDTYIRC